MNRNKITACVIAAASVVSMFPTGSFAAEKEIKSTKGTIYRAAAYKDGKFYIAGEPKSKDESAYYFSNGSYNELKDIDADDTIKIYGSKYLVVEDGDYYVDLESGKVKEEKIEETETDKAAVNLRSSVKSDNDGRFDESDAKEIKEVKAIPNAKFNDDWYETSYKVKEVSENINGGEKELTVYTDKDGKYIDADYNLGKVKVKLSSGKNVTLNNTNDKEDTVTAKVTDSKTIAQDKDNIYRLAKITVKTGASGTTIKSVNGLDITDSTTAFTLSNDGASVSFNVIQVISKGHNSKKIDGIRYSKNVTNYILGDKEGKKVDLLNSDTDSFTVANGKLINYKIGSSSVEAAVISLNTKSSNSYIDVENSDTAKFEGGKECVDIDVDGNIWVLTKDYIRKFDNKEDFEKVYDLDDEYTNFSVYNKDNLVVWNEDEKIYSIVGGNEKKTDTDVVEDNGNNNANNNNNNNNNNGNSNNNANNGGNQNGSNPSGNVTVGWVKDTSTGNWTYNEASGTKKTGWLNDNGTWYYLDLATGIMKTGWVNDNGTWYYMQPSGAMRTGWVNDNGTWYYMQSSGAMKTGWLNDNGTWYYLNSSGAMLSNTTINGYRLGSSGAWIK
ncbi:N-acetylmuramoyl-L-alanine amidase family protein [uncultured Clostridium sp.]|uniref:N-acetylmuramoyl-L-alanine amidase family protein n=1 Tax=uncultured Clostridium sp. TaxID=59620 RepID=UPI0025F1321E|nr:N-acetylmuramoyl-L-alanine amidase family protein [uncultured Clostridium sp.]